MCCPHLSCPCWTPCTLRQCSAVPGPEYPESNAAQMSGALAGSCATSNPCLSSRRLLPGFHRHSAGSPHRRTSSRDSLVSCSVALGNSRAAPPPSTSLSLRRRGKPPRHRGTTRGSGPDQGSLPSILTYADQLPYTNLGTTRGIGQDSDSSSSILDYADKPLCRRVPLAVPAPTWTLPPPFWSSLTRSSTAWAPLAAPA